jgi:hypothetical protein
MLITLGRNKLPTFVTLKIFGKITVVYWRASSIKCWHIIPASINHNNSGRKLSSSSLL